MDLKYLQQWVCHGFEVFAAVGLKYLQQWVCHRFEGFAAVGMSRI